MSSKDQLKPMRACKAVLDDWAAELAVKLNRPEFELRTGGLSAYDFSPARSVEVRYPFGCTHKVSSAFAVIRPQAGMAAVFSEHAGYLEFELIEDCVVAEIHEDIYRHE